MEVQVKRAFKSYYIFSFVGKNKRIQKLTESEFAISLTLKSAPLYFPPFSKTISQVPGQDQQQQNGI